MVPNSGSWPFNAAVKAIYDSLKFQAEGGKPSDVGDTQAGTDLMGIATGGASYKAWRGSFLSE